VCCFCVLPWREPIPNCCWARLWRTSSARLAQGLPDILLIAEEEAGESVTSLTAQVLERYPDLPVVRVGLRQNVVRLYTSRTLPARSADLIEAIRGLPIHQRKSKTNG
jgi:hypothetical protein